MDDDVLECRPLSFEELMDWDSGMIDGVRAESLTVPLAKHVAVENNVSKAKVLVCHDMKGGYLDEDRFCTDFRPKEGPAYRFYHWSQIDTFVYFSHNFVTIPPVPWVNAAHKNGVSILGTFITESVELGQKIFSDPAIVLMVVQKLVAIAKQHSLEGWLLNIENPIAQGFVDNLLLFVTILTAELHEAIPGSLVIWYDSVLYPSGRLHWQNALNAANVSFFQNCDGIFLNYNWNVFNLRNSIQTAQSINRCPQEIYVGIDVFGRGCFGGGGWNTRAAIDEIRKVSSDLSLAIFAPGWVHECNPVADFECNQAKFWNKLSLPLRHVPSQLPIVTNFCHGFGNKMFKKGQKIDENSWFNLSRQELIHLGHSSSILKNRIYTEESFEGGSCLRLRFQEVDKKFIPKEIMPPPASSLPTDLADDKNSSLWPLGSKCLISEEPVIKCHVEIPEKEDSSSQEVEGVLVSLTFKPLFTRGKGDKEEGEREDTATNLLPQAGSRIVEEGEDKLSASSSSLFTLTFTSRITPMTSSSSDEEERNDNFSSVLIRKPYNEQMSEFCIQNEIPMENINGWITLIALIKPSLVSSSSGEIKKKILSEIWIQINDFSGEISKKNPQVLIGQLKMLESVPGLLND